MNESLQVMHQILAEFRLLTLNCDSNFVDETDLYDLLQKTHDLKCELDKFRLSLAGSLARRLKEKHSL